MKAFDTLLEMVKRARANDKGARQEFLKSYRKPALVIAKRLICSLRRPNHGCDIEVSMAAADLLETMIQLDAAQTSNRHANLIQTKAAR